MALIASRLSPSSASTRPRSKPSATRRPARASPNGVCSSPPSGRPSAAALRGGASERDGEERPPRSAGAAAHAANPPPGKRVAPSRSAPAGTSVPSRITERRMRAPSPMRTSGPMTVSGPISTPAPTRTPRAGEHRRAAGGAGERGAPAPGRGARAPARPATNLAVRGQVARRAAGLAPVAAVDEAADAPAAGDELGVDLAVDLPGLARRDQRRRPPARERGCR